MGRFIREFIFKYINCIEELRKFHLYQYSVIYQTAKCYRVSYTVSAMHPYKHIRLLFMYELIDCKIKIPKLELMSSLLLLRLIVSVRKALSVQVKILNVFSWSDSKVALY